jgi:hypothetical protein
MLEVAARMTEQVIRGFMRTNLYVTNILHSYPKNVLLYGEEYLQRYW